MAKKPAKGKITGQGQPIDAQMDLFWRDNRNFAEVFNKAVFNGQLINPNELEDVNLAETTILRLKDGDYDNPQANQRCCEILNIRRCMAGHSWDRESDAH